MNDAVNLYVKRRKLGVLGDMGFYVPVGFEGVWIYGWFRFVCKIVHGHVTEMGFGNPLHVGNELMGIRVGADSARSGCGEEALELFGLMRTRGVGVDAEALAAVVSTCGEFCWDQKACALSRLNLISWRAVIGAFASKGREDASLELFRKMRFAQVKANAVTISTVLSVCAGVRFTEL
ncbi:hypothetical protein Tsubulata_026728 [Turnera subulata]|uniref:Pentatricopeptide repeat-containing protein n=1 Tax=Turnera subulata TaxID=218843 RepID=A0A9Q0JP83_9ROSI|nr:hypothetical protein Tsubulata_026728 [Turnera subulata]